MRRGRDEKSKLSIVNLKGLHLLLTFRCDRACDHCFVWGSPRRTGTMTLKDIDHILSQAREAGMIEEIWLEGGEPFLYYGVLVEGVRRAKKLGFRTGIVTNGYWAQTVEDAGAWLAPLKGCLDSLLVSCDNIHWDSDAEKVSGVARAAAGELGIPIGVLATDLPRPEKTRKTGEPVKGIMYRGRAAVKMTPGVATRPWDVFGRCPYESLGDPARVHVDHLGNLHVCQGITMGNLAVRPLKDILGGFDPASHPVIGPLVAGGPAELIRRWDVPHHEGYVDACHACYEARKALRDRFRAVLAPDGMYGEDS